MLSQAPRLKAVFSVHPEAREHPVSWPATSRAPREKSHYGRFAYSVGSATKSLFRASFHEDRQGNDHNHIHVQRVSTGPGADHGCTCLDIAGCAARPRQWHPARTSSAASGVHARTGSDAFRRTTSDKRPRRRIPAPPARRSGDGNPNRNSHVVAQSNGPTSGNKCAHKRATDPASADRHPYDNDTGADCRSSDRRSSHSGSLHRHNDGCSDRHSRGDCITILCNAAPDAYIDIHADAYRVQVKDAHPDSNGHGLARPDSNTRRHANGHSDFAAKADLGPDAHANFPATLTSPARIQSPPR